MNSNLKKVIVIGLGQFGRTVAETLTQHNIEVLAVDKDEKIVEDFKDKVASVVQLDVTNEEALKTQGLDDFDLAIVAIGERYFLASVLGVALLKKLGVPKVIARGIRTDSRIEEKILELVGADRVVLPSVETAKRLALDVLSTNILSYIPVSSGYSVVKVVAPKKFIDKSISELSLRDKYKINLIGIQRDDKSTNYLPRSSDIIRQGDTLFIIGKEEDVEKISKLKEE
ncbi:TrkA family potassium uptake protein [bacterium]|nr:TrkA family potassium uptake protein [bacterium]